MDEHRNSVLEINPDVSAIAQSMDERFDELSHLPLYGVPILLKDNICTQDQMHTSAGSLALAEWHAPRDAYVVAQLRQAGAIILGKTNMTEWTNFMSDTMWAGYSSRGGQVKNPYGDFFVGGSSSGFAVAVAANLGMAAIGSETSGSIISPCSQNSLVGIKPTVGLVSRSGVIPLSISQDTLGPMTRSVRDASLLLDIIMGEDAADPYTINPKCPHGSTPVLDQRRTFTVGVAEHLLIDLDAEMLQLFETALEALTSIGVKVIRNVEIPASRIKWDYEVLRHEFKAAINTFLCQHPEHIPVHSLTDLIRFNAEHPDTCLKYGQNILEWVDQITGSLEERAYLESKEQNKLAREQGIDYALSTYQLDALVYPENVGSDLSARAGYPVVTVPAGYYASGRPMGIAFSGTAYSESALL